MASSSNVSLDQLSSVSLARVEKDPDLRATLAAIADRIHAQPDQASAIALKDWEQWLDGEGYNTESLRAFISSLLRSESISKPLSLIGLEQNVSSLISVMEKELPDLLDLLLDTVDHSVKLHESLFGLAGGTAQQPLRNSLKIQSKKKLATREAAAEVFSHVASSDSANATVVGRDGAGEQKEYSRGLDAVRGDLQRSKDGRVGSRESRPGAMNAREDRPGIDRSMGRNGSGEQKINPQERSVETQIMLDTLRKHPRIREAREVLERDFRDIEPTSLSKMLDDLRSDVVQISQDARGRREVLNDNQRSDEVQISQDARGRREVLNRDYNDPDLRLVRAIENVRNALEVREDVRETLKVESDLTKAVAALKFELDPKQLERDVERLFDVDGRGGSGEQKDYSRAIDKARDELSDSRLDAPRLMRVLKDLRAVKGMEDYLGRRTFDKLAEDLNRRINSEFGGELDSRLKEAVNKVRDDLERGRNLIREVERISDFDGRNGGGELKEYSRAIDRAMDELSERGIEVPRLKSVLKDLRAIKGLEDYVGRRTFEKLAEDLNSYSGGELDFRVKEAVSNVRDDLERARNLIREVENDLRDALNPNSDATAEFSELTPGMMGATEDRPGVVRPGEPGYRGGGEQRVNPSVGGRPGTDHVRIAEAMAELSDSRLDAPRLMRVLKDLRAVKGMEDYLGRRTFDKLAEDLNRASGGELDSRLKEAVNKVRDDLERGRNLIREVERISDFDGRNGGGELKDYSRAIDRAMDELSDRAIEVPRLKSVLKDLRAIKGVEDYVGRRTFEKLAEDLNSYSGGELDFRLKEAVDNLSNDLARGRNLIRDVERISDFAGRNGGGEQTDFSRAIEKARQESQRVLNDLRNIRVWEGTFLRQFDELEKALNDLPNDRLDDSLRDVVDRKVANDLRAIRSWEDQLIRKCDDIETELNKLPRGPLDDRLRMAVDQHMVDLRRALVPVPVRIGRR